MSIIGISLIKNEDLFVGRVLRNALSLCDHILVADNGSSDGTLEIVTGLAAEDSRIRVHRVNKPSESHALVEPYAGTDTWVFGVDGDELYDPSGLARFRGRLLSGEFSPWWALFGNVLNCTRLDPVAGVAEGYLAPPCRSMTKLYNFAAIDSWTGPCSERLHDGTITFRKGYSADLRRNLHEEVEWDAADFRCLHTCFLPRSSRDPVHHATPVARQNIADVLGRSFFQRIIDVVLPFSSSRRQSALKRDKYMRGPLVTRNVAGFFP